jgi:hypothetical protein
MKENKSLVTVIIVLAFIVVGYVIWVSYANKKVREVVDTSLERIEQRLEAKGNDVTITYDDLNVHSFSLRPRVSLYKMHMKITDRRGREAHVMIPEVLYTPKTFNMRSYKVEVLDSVTLMSTKPGEEQESTLVDFSKSPVLDVDVLGNGDVQYSALVPEHISLTDVNEESDIASAMKTDINFESSPQVQWSISNEGINLDQKAVFPKTTVTYGGDVLAEADGIRVETQHSLVSENVHSYAMQAELNNLNFADAELAVLNPVSVVNDVTFTGPIPLNEEQAEALKDIPSEYKLKNIAWMSGLMSMFANGSVVFDPAEKIPHGEINLSLNDVDKFFAYVEKQRPQTKDYMLKVRDALEQLAGASIGEGGSVTIKLHREQEGRLYIGELNLEESIGLFIEMALQLPDLSAPAAKAEEPASEEVTEEAAVEEAPAEDMTETAEEPVLQTEEADDAPAPVQEEEESEVNEEEMDDAASEEVTEEVQTESTDTSVEDVEIEVRTNTDDVTVEVIEPQTEEAPVQEDETAEEGMAVPVQ